MRTIAFVIAFLMSASAFAADVGTSGSVEVVEFQADLFTGTCSYTMGGRSCYVPSAIGKPFQVALNPTNEPGHFMGSVFLRTGAEGVEFDAQVIVHHYLPSGRYGVEVLHTSAPYGYAPRPMRSLGYVDVANLGELNQFQFIGDTLSAPDHWTWSAVAVGPKGKALSAQTLSQPQP